MAPAKLREQQTHNVPRGRSTRTEQSTHKKPPVLLTSPQATQTHGNSALTKFFKAFAIQMRSPWSPTENASKPDANTAAGEVRLCSR
jgi:hypothetical protein